MYESQALGHELLKRSDAWRNPETLQQTPWSEQIAKTGHDLINGDAVILPRPKTWLGRIKLLCASFQ